MEDKMTPKEIAEEAYSKRKMFSDPFKHDEWINSLEFRIKELVDEGKKRPLVSN